MKYSGLIILLQTWVCSAILVNKWILFLSEGIKILKIKQIYKRLFILVLMWEVGKRLIGDGFLFFFLGCYHFEAINPFMIFMVRLRLLHAEARNAGSVNFEFLLHHLFSNFNVRIISRTLQHSFLSSFCTDSESVHQACAFAFLTTS